MRKPFYKIKGTNDYGVLEVQVRSNHSSYLQLRLVNAVGGMIELSHQYEDVTTENLVEVSPEEVLKALLGLTIEPKKDDSDREQSFFELAGIWEGKNITLDDIRKDAWGKENQ